MYTNPWQPLISMRSGCQHCQKARRRAIMKAKYLPYMFMAPALILLLFVYGSSILGAVFLSFTDWNGIDPVIRFVGLGNFVSMFSGTSFVIPLKNTLLFLVLTLILQNALALFMALLLNNKFFGRDLFRMLFFLPSTISMIAIGLAWTLIFDPINGSIVHIANMLSLHAIADIQWLGSPNLVMYCIAFVNIWQWAGWNMVIYLAGLQAIPTEIYEAVSIDGASALARLRYITIPMLAPAITINVIMTTIGGLKVFDLPFIMTGGGPGQASETLTMTIVENAFSLNKMGYGSAMSLVLFIMILLVTVIQNKVLGKAEEAVQA
jgi:raffinose/stachyose/melibiose transport system permease protein